MLQSLHADHDDQPGRSAGFGVCVDIDVVSTTTTIHRGIGISDHAITSYLTLDDILITINECIKLFNKFKVKLQHN
jgi:hypothetical protein